MLFGSKEWMNAFLRAREQHGIPWEAPIEREHVEGFRKAQVTGRLGPKEALKELFAGSRDAMKAFRTWRFRTHGTESGGTDRARRCPRVAGSLEAWQKIVSAPPSPSLPAPSWSTSCAPTPPASPTRPRPTRPRPSAQAEAWDYLAWHLQRSALRKLST